MESRPSSKEQPESYHWTLELLEGHNPLHFTAYICHSFMGVQLFSFKHKLHIIKNMKLTGLIGSGVKSIQGFEDNSRP